MRRLLLLPAAALLVAVLVPALGGSASAGPTTSWITCPSGTASTGELTIDGARAGSILDLSGWVSPCRTPKSTDVYAVAAYSGGSGSAAQDADSPRKFYDKYASAARSYFSGSIRLKPGTEAICLVTGERARVQCYAVTVAAVGSAPVVGGAIPTDDPRVTAPIACPRPEDQDPPACGTC